MDENLRLIHNELSKYKLHDKIKIIVSDNCSIDNTKNIILKWKDKFKFFEFHLNKNNLGAPQNLTNLITKSKSKYTFLLSDDDFIEAASLSYVINLLEIHEPDVVYLNYKPVETVCNSDRCRTQNAKTIIHPCLRLNGDIVLNDRNHFLKTFFSLGFFQTRILLSQQSVVIFKTDFMKENIQILKSVKNFTYEKIFYPHSAYLWETLPQKFLLINKTCILITVNNKSWNNDPRIALKQVNNSFLPLLNSIAQKYGSKDRIVNLYVLLSKIYSFATYIIVISAYYLRLGKILNKRI